METVKEQKNFDCLKMKNEIQAEIYAEIKDMTTEERIAYFRISPEQDPFRQVTRDNEKKQISCI